MTRQVYKHVRTFSKVLLIIENVKKWVFALVLVLLLLLNGSIISPKFA